MSKKKIVENLYNTVFSNKPILGIDINDLRDIEEVIEKNEPNEVIEPKETNYLLTSHGDYYLSNDQTIVNEIKSGIYDLHWDGPRNCHFLKEKKISLDELYDLKSTEMNLIKDDVEKFISIEKRNYFKKYNFTYKRGYLLYGKQGIGKTSLINMLALKFINEGLNIIVFHISSARELDNYIIMISEIRKREPEKLFFFIIEDIDNFLKYNEVESSLINFLDGIDQVFGVITFATTNYPEQLKERITNRPNRFDKRVEIPLPTKDVRHQYFQEKFKLIDDEDKKMYNMEHFVEKTQNYSLAHCQELFKSVVIFQNDFDETISFLNEMNGNEHVTTTKLKKIGF